MSIATINPTTGVTEQEFSAHDAAEVERRIALADAAATTLRTTTYAQRSEWMRAAADALEADVDELARLITVEMGKPIAQSRGEVLKCVRSEEHTSELQSRPHLVCRLLLEKKKIK